MRELFSFLKLYVDADGSLFSQNSEEKRFSAFYFILHFVLCFLIDEQMPATVYYLPMLYKVGNWVYDEKGRLLLWTTLTQYRIGKDEVYRQPKGRHMMILYEEMTLNRFSF